MHRGCLAPDSRAGSPQQCMSGLSIRSRHQFGDLHVQEEALQVRRPCTPPLYEATERTKQIEQVLPGTGCLEVLLGSAESAGRNGILRSGSAANR